MLTLIRYGMIPAIVLLSTAWSGSRSLAFELSKPRNVVVFLVDDLGYMDIAANNPDTFYETPNVDRLARTGMRFTHGYSACPVCSPTRYSILTGKYPTRAGLTNWLVGNREARFRGAPLIDRMPLDEVTLAESLKEHNLATFFAGKWHLGPDGFGPQQQGFSTVGMDGRGNHLPDHQASETVQFLEQNSAKPFFAYLCFNFVHIPIEATPELQSKYDAKARKLGLSDDAAFADEEQVWPNDNARKVRTRQTHAVYAAMVEAMDQAVGKVLDKLDQLKLAENTVVWFMSDNGGLSTAEGSPTSNVPLRGGKGWLYEGGIRVPFIVRAPGITEPGRTCDVPVMSIDVYPTLLDLLGLPARPADGLDGVSLAPLLRGEPSIDREALYWHYPHYSNQGGFPGGAIREGDWKLIERFEDGRVQLYNLRQDERESDDRAADESERVDALRAKLHAWYRQIGAKFLEANRNAAEPWRP